MRQYLEDAVLANDHKADRLSEPHTTNASVFKCITSGLNSMSWQPRVLRCRTVATAFVTTWSSVIFSLYLTDNCMHHELSSSFAQSCGVMLRQTWMQMCSCGTMSQMQSSVAP